MKIKRLFAQILAIALCLTLLCPLAALAEDTESSTPKDPEGYAVINPTAMQKLVEDYANAKGYDKGNIRVGYCYLDTGDTWFYNGDSWGFGAGVYYVPMMMILAEWETDGKLTRDSKISGYTLGEAEHYILTESNNNIKNIILNGAFGSQRELREKMQAYSSLKESEYNSDYMDYGYVSPRFLMDVLKTLYNENKRFPNIIECMKARGVNDCFHGAMGGAYDVAQQFGSYEENGGNEYNNCMGILYTPHPFALVVMTKNLGHTQEVMRDMAIIYKDYTLTLDGAYDKWNGKNEPATVAPTVTEPEQQPEQQPEGENEQPTTGQTIIPMPGSETSTEPETPTEEQPEQGGTQVIIPTEQGTPGEEPAQTEQEPEQKPEQQLEQKPEQQPEQKPQQEKQEKSPASGRMILLLVGAAIFVILFLFAIVRIVKNRRDEDYDDEDEDDEDEDDEDEDEDDEDLKY